MEVLIAGGWQRCRVSRLLSLLLLPDACLQLAVFARPEGGCELCSHGSLQRADAGVQMTRLSDWQPQCGHINKS